MTKNEVVLFKIKNLVKDKMPDSELYLFGSRARGESKAHSDWDLLLLLNLQQLTFESENQIIDAFSILKLKP